MWGALTRTALFWTGTLDVCLESSGATYPGSWLQLLMLPLSLRPLWTLTFTSGPVFSWPPGTSLFSDIPLFLGWDCLIYHNCSLLFFVNQNYLCLELKVPRNLSLVVLNHLLLNLPQGLEDFWFIQMFLYTIPATWFASKCKLSQLASYILHPVTMCWTFQGTFA